MDSKIQKFKNMEWSFGQDKMLSTLETLLKPERSKRYICCIFRKKKY